jgi:hypothetical protein
LIRADDMKIGSPGHPRARPSATTIACAGLALFVGGGCGNSTLDLYNPDLGLLAHWTFDEGVAGSGVLDSSGFGFHATPSTNPPTPSRDVPPVHFFNPFSLSFDGQDQWVNAGNPSLLNAGGIISITAWVRAANIAGYHNVLAHGWRNGPNHDVALRINGGNYEFTYWNSADHLARAPIADSDVGAWIHLCGVFDGSAYRIYRNGVEAASTPDTTAPPPNVDTPWAIGGRAPQPDSLERLFEGQIDDIRIYGRALGAAEIEALYRR